VWITAVEPILVELGFVGTPTADEPWPRLWWVASGLLSILPIHAAGYHERPGCNAIDRVVCSYTPTIASLSYSRERHMRIIENQKIVLTSLKQTVEYSTLPFAKEEVNEIKKMLPPQIQIEVLQTPKKAQVLSALRGHQIAHFACHASLCFDPSQSRLLLADSKTSPFTVSDIAALNIPHAQMAYISACHVAVMKILRLLDESINLASAIRLAGYPSVIGSLWQVSNEHSVEIAKEVYGSMLVEKSTLKTERSAEGLSRAHRERNCSRL